MTEKRLLYTIAVPSTEFLSGAYWDGKGPSPGICFRYQKGGVKYQSAINFQRVLAIRTRAERGCTAWHIEGAYDNLVEIENSPWVSEVRADTNPQWRDQWAMHHFMIYLDSVGCFEVIAESWAAFEEPEP